MAIIIDEITLITALTPIYGTLIWIAISLQRMKEIVMNCPYCMERRKKILIEENAKIHP